jgi:hypothetical protein
MPSTLQVPNLTPKHYIRLLRLPLQLQLHFFIWPEDPIRLEHLPYPQC